MRRPEEESGTADARSRTPPTSVIRDATAADSAAIANVYVQAFPAARLSGLGQGFVHSYFAALLSSGIGFGAVALDEEGSACGFVVGYSGVRTTLRVLRSGWRMLLLASCRAVWDQPRRVRGIFVGLLRTGRPVVEHGDTFLAAIAVTSSSRGQRIGAGLLTRFLERAHQAGSRRVVLEVEPTGTVAVSLYRSHGFRTVRIRATPTGSDVMVLDLPPTHTS